MTSLARGIQALPWTTLRREVIMSVFKLICMCFSNHLAAKVKLKLGHSEACREGSRLPGIKKSLDRASECILLLENLISDPSCAAPTS
jgi:hypothetical protein